jgi:hypothetical protein
MKKFYALVGLVLIPLIISACTIPKAVEIKGTPKLKLATNMDFNDFFSDMTKGAFGNDLEGLVVQECPNVDGNAKTFLIRMILFPEMALDVSDLSSYVVGSDLVIPSASLPSLYDTDSTTGAVPTKLPFDSFTDQIPGLKFKASSIKTRVFVDGPAFIHIDIKSGTSELSLLSSPIDGSTTPKKVEMDEGSTYSGKDMPSGGAAIDISKYLVGQEAVDIKFQMDLKAGTYPKTVLDNAKVAIEMLVWLPLELEPDPASPNLATLSDGREGAEMVLPEQLSEIGGFISSIPDVIKTLKLSIGLNDNPFDGDILRVKSNTPALDILNDLTDSLNFEFKADALSKINEASTYDPVFSIFIPMGSTVAIPKTFKIMSFYIEAHIAHRIDFMGGDSGDYLGGGYEF